MSIRDELKDVAEDAWKSAVDKYWNAQKTCTLGQSERVAREAFQVGMSAAVDAILARYAVVELPTLEDSDDDGQIYTDVTELRIDTTGRHGDEVFRGAHQISPYWLRREAAELLAAANRAEAADVDR